jgi:hypothetical protein
MSSTLGFSDFNTNEEDTELKKEFEKKRKNKTIKNREQNTEKVEQFLNSMENMESEDSDEEQEGLAEFHPPPKPQLLTKNDNVKENFKPQSLNIDHAVTPEGFKTLKEKYQQAYNQYVPYYTNSSAGSEMNYANRDELMRKLNYLIHMMEENKDEKTENVTEELVLYLFLGVFVIFVVDSFARAGKYTR